MTTIAYSSTSVQRPIGLLFLLDYALSHPHSAQWIAAIHNLLARLEVRHDG